MSYFDIVKLDPVNNYFLYSESELDELKRKIDADRLTAFRQDMEDLFSKPLESVCTKQNAPEGASLHDYASLGTYWWPDDSRDSRLPYIQRDGYANPEGQSYDKDKLRRLAYLVYHAGILFYITREKRYIELVQKHLHHWFINEDTRMNPNMNHGQFVPGRVNGRAEGIIDYSANFSYALNIIYILNNKKMIDPELQEGLVIWHRQFRDWLLESPIGKAEDAAKNNHGTFYDFVLCVIEQYLGMTGEIGKRKGPFLERRIRAQTAPDFSLPEETARTKSLSYTFMGLKGFLDTAKLMKHESADLFPELKGTVDWLYNAAIVNRNTWPHEQVTQFDEGIYLLFKDMVSHIYGDQYRKITDYINPDKIINKVLAYLHS